MKLNFLFFWKCKILLLFTFFIYPSVWTHWCIFYIFQWLSSICIPSTLEIFILQLFISYMYCTTCLASTLPVIRDSSLQMRLCFLTELHCYVITKRSGVQRILVSHKMERRTIPYDSYFCTHLTLASYLIFSLGFLLFFMWTSLIFKWLNILKGLEEHYRISHSKGWGMTYRGCL